MFEITRVDCNRNTFKTELFNTDKSNINNMASFFFYLFELEFYVPINAVKIMSSLSVDLLTRRAGLVL